MRRKLGTVIVMDIKGIGEVYLGEGNVIATSLSGAKNFRTSKKILAGLCAEAKRDIFPSFEMKVTTMERWIED